MKHVLQLIIITIIFVNTECAQNTTTFTSTDILYPSKSNAEIKYSTIDSNSDKNHGSFSADETSVDDPEIISSTESSSERKIVENHSSSSSESVLRITLPSVAESELEDNSLYLSSSEEISTENGCSTEEYSIEDITVNATQDTIQMSWKPHIYADRCEVKYDVNITAARYNSREIPYFRQEINTFHNFTRLTPCTAYNVSMQANEGEIFQKQIRTLPGKVENLNIKMKGNKTRIQWSASRNIQCSIYRILLDDKIVHETKSSFYELDGNVYCTNVAVVNVDGDRRVGEPTVRAVPGTVQNLSVIPEENSLAVSWKSPIDATCVTGYILKILDDEISLNETLEYIVENLEACTLHTVQVAALSDTDRGEFVSQSANTTLPAQVGPVVNLALTPQGNIYLNASWDPPFRQGACVTRYNLELWNQHDQNMGAQSTNTTFFTYSPLVGCMTYNVQVKPVVSESIDGNTRIAQEIIGDIPANPPILRNSVVVDKTWAQMTFSLDTYSTNMCTITRVYVKCEALEENNEDLPWIITPKEEDVDYVDSNLRLPAVINVTELSEFTNYTCFATVINTWGESNRSVEITFQTMDGVPSAPQNLQVSEITSTSFKVTWEKPNKIPGQWADYHLIVVNENPMHYIPDDCEISPTEVSLHLNSTYFNFTEGLPNFNYSVAVAAFTTAGVGPTVEKFASTFTSASEQPRYLQYKFDHISVIPYSVTASLDWILPCNTNGNIEKFLMEINGTSTWDNSSDYRLENIPVNTPIQENVIYSFGIENIRALYNYTVELWAVSADDNPGNRTFLSFGSPEGLPSAPTITNVTVTAESVIIIWNQPVHQNGKLIKYRVSIIVDGPLHFIPEDCSIRYEDHHEDNVTTDETSFTFRKGLPNFNYTVVVVAATAAGLGELSDPWNFQTLPTASEAPRNFTYSLNNTLGDTYDVIATLDWILPCNTNGDISHFIISILSESFGDGDDDDNDQSTSTENLIHSFSLRPLRNYTVAVFAFGASKNNISGHSAYVYFPSPDGWPSPPTITQINVTVDFVTIIWNEPLNKNGILQNYMIVIRPIGALHFIPKECKINDEVLEFVVAANGTSFQFKQGFPNYNYSVNISAATRAGYGLPSTPSSFLTLESYPEKVRNVTQGDILFEQNENYSAAVTIYFLPPCNLNGNFRFYEIEIVAVRSSFEDLNDIFTIDDVNKTVFLIDLRPESNYTISVSVLTEHFQGSAFVLESFTSPSGVPPEAINNLTPPFPNGTSKAIFNFSNDLFNNSFGNILYYSLILSGINEHANISVFGFWDGTEYTWPPMNAWSETGAIKPYQVTPIRWKPFLNREKQIYTFIIGEENCTHVEDFCNGPLRASTEYALIVRGFTSRGFRNTAYVTFTTPSDLQPGLNLALILGLIFGILAAVLISIFIFILWRRRRKQNLERLTLDPLIPASVPAKQFPKHYSDMRENLNKLKAEYSLLEKKSAELAISSDTAVTDENKKKNRYINILPYDDTRVKLDTDKNANYSDYINASHVKGYSGSEEYIATQGPLESTVVDFWRMVMQENVAVIVMVAQFVEQGKQKCHKYFPNNHETMEIGDGIEIRCSNELNFGCYTVRSLLVQRELNQWTITHLQFTDWPDFGCPSGTKSMLQFCNVMRSYIEKHKTKTIVHCSAGVGRTGTLIATDILRQTIENNGDVNVFKTVFNMRRQRSHMVQTEKQYMYIYTCIKDQILNPLKSEENTSEPIYENVNILQNIYNAESAL